MHTDHNSTPLKHPRKLHIKPMFSSRIKKPNTKVKCTVTNSTITRTPLLFYLSHFYKLVCATHATYNTKAFLYFVNKKKKSRRLVLNPYIENARLEGRQRNCAGLGYKK